MLTGADPDGDEIAHGLNRFSAQVPRGSRPPDGAANRRRLLTSSNAAVNAESEETRFGCAFHRPRPLQTINDKLGAPRWRPLSAELARRLRENLRHYDILARWGGDNSSSSSKGAQSRTNRRNGARLHKQLAVPLALDGYEVIPSASIGVARYPKATARAACD